MKASERLFDFGRPVAFYPGLVKYLGSVNAVLFFCQIFYWLDKAESDLGVYKTVEEIEEETGMTYREQVTARRHLVERGVLVETHKRLEHRIYYKIDIEKLDALLESADFQERNSRTAESAIREEAKAQSVNRTEITTETTLVIGKRAREQKQETTLPEWLDAGVWNDFLAMRKQIRKPMTERAKTLMLSKLQRFRDAGHDVHAMLENSIVNCWQDVYEPKAPARPAGKPLRPSQQLTQPRRYVGTPEDEIYWLK